MINPLKRRGKIFFPMHGVSMPVVDADPGLKDAIAQVRRSKEKGVIVRTGKDFHLHTVTGLTRAFGTGNAIKLRDLAGYPIYLGNRTTIAGSKPKRFISSEALVHDLRLSGKKFGLLSAPTHRAKRATVYYLGGDRVQYAEPEPKDRCPRCRKFPCEC